jgi:lipid-A-disaccharide synthase
MGAEPDRLQIFIVVGESSGDQLGAKLIQALRRQVAAAAFFGTAGEAMEAAGLKSLFPLTDIAVMGFVPVIQRLPLLIRRVHCVVDAIVATRPDLLVIIDSPDFTHAVARRVRRRLPHLPVIDYVCPSVWAWRQGRARKMRRYIDHVLALLPFEPEALRRLDGPACTYVGHPLLERLSDLPAEGFAANQLLVLPGSRRAEIERLMPIFGQTVALLSQSIPDLDVIVPAVLPHAERIKALASQWSMAPRIVLGETAKWAAFRGAQAALAASGTVTLELALAGVPMVVGYAVSPIEAAIARRMIKVPSIVLPNLILGENAIPQLLQEHCRPSELLAHLAPLMRDSSARAHQRAALKRIEARMRLPEGEAPSACAARIVADLARRQRLPMGR